MLRLIIQPAVAALLAVRAGLADARAGRPAYLWSVFTDRDHRLSLIQSGWPNIARIFLLACVIDAIYQILEFQWFYPLQALIVAFLLAIVPYVAVRGPVTRLARRMGATTAAAADGSPLAHTPRRSTRSA
jgi:hypothetical protein